MHYLVIFVTLFHMVASSGGKLRDHRQSQTLEHFRGVQIKSMMFKKVEEITETPL